MKPYEKVGKIIVKVMNSTVNFAVLVLLLVLLVIGSYALWDSNQVYQAADNSIYAMYRPITEGAESFEELQQMNAEVIAWLTVFGTTIDYPVVQGENNSKYVNTDVKGNYSLSGSLFLDYENAADFSDFNNIIYGHHMDKSVMFGGIEHFGEKTYFDEHRYGTLFHHDQEYGIEFFAFLEVDAYDFSIYNVAVAKNARTKFIENLLEKAKHTRHIGVQIDDNIVLLSTCTSDSTNGRHILAGRITDEIPQNIFYSEEEPEEQEQRYNINGQPKLSVWERVPRWAWWVLWVLLILLLYLVVDELRKQSVQKNKKESGLYEHVSEKEEDNIK